MARAPSVAIMIINYNGLKWLPTCLTSVARTDYPRLDVYMVDNGSSDGSIEYVKKNFPWIKVIQHPRNLGFAEGYNRAIQKTEADYLVLLNNDVEVLDPGWVKFLVDAVTEDPKNAAVACKMVSMEDNSHLDSVGGMGIPFWRGFVDIGRTEHDRRQYDHEGFEPFAFCGGAALIKRDIFVRLGGFDGKFFLYVEDADFSWRLRLMGYKIAFAPEAKVAHHFSGSTGGKANALKIHYCHRNLLRAIIKNCGSSLRWALKNYLLFSFIVAVGFYILDPMKASAFSRAILWNLFNLRGTYSWRLRIQSCRTGSEAEILTKMFPQLARHQPSEHIRLRRILNTLFEHSQLSTFSTVSADLRTAGPKHRIFP